jgi:pyridoxine 5-phosphate synthase
LKPRLGVNIDHVATLRQQRGESYPNVERAAELSLKAGADQITIHLREDRRHIQDRDVPAVQQICAGMNKLFNFEMGCSSEMIELASTIKPDWVCLVPEKREERTTEGGLALTATKDFERVQHAVETILFKSPQTRISLFVEADPKTLESCVKMPIHAVEIHTGDFARDFLFKKPLGPHLELYKNAYQIMKNAQMGFHAGHGLTKHSLTPLLDQGLFEEYNIGHWIIGESVFCGIDSVVRNLVQQMSQKI